MKLITAMHFNDDTNENPKNIEQQPNAIILFFGVISKSNGKAHP